MEVYIITYITYSENLRDQLHSLETLRTNCAHKINLRDQHCSFTFCEATVELHVI